MGKTNGSKLVKFGKIRKKESKIGVIPLSEITQHMYIEGKTAINFKHYS